MKPTTLNLSDRASDVMLLLPVPIRADAYLNNLTWSKLGTPEEAVAKEELARMLQIYQRFGAYLQPLRYRSGRTVWEVRFPAGSRWKSGPEQPAAWAAIVENYVRNKKFSGQFTSVGKDGESVKRLEEIHAAAHKNDNEKLQGIIL